MDRERLRRLFLAVLLVLVTAVFLAMIRRFLVVLLLAALLAGLAHPLYRGIRRGFRGRRHLASGTTLLVLLVAVVAPLSLLLGLVAGEALQISNQVGPWVSAQVNEPSRLLERIPGAERLAPYRPEVLQRLGQIVGSVGSFLFDSISAFTRGTVSLLFQLFLLLYAMFFFLADGETILAKTLGYLPLRKEDKRELVEKFASVTRATIKGTLVIGVVQGTLAGAAFALAGIQGALFWGTVMTFLSIIPGVGTGLVWLPAGIIQLAKGNAGGGVFVLAFCTLVVSTVDNLLRPRLVGRDTKMHPLLVLFSTLGGLFLFGVVGFLIGPILGALFVAVWDFYARAFRESLLEADPLPSAETSDEAGAGGLIAERPPPE
ncbi:MAG: AI-2E family transporter [Candidatus Eisenbacteria bacterium]|nr:AI-2E family transporter [Candidatus Eisenbacteria bacterium]